MVKFWNEEMETLPRERMKDLQFERLGGRGLAPLLIGRAGDAGDAVAELQAGQLAVLQAGLAAVAGDLHQVGPGPVAGGGRQHAGRAAGIGEDGVDLVLVDLVGHGWIILPSLDL